MRKIKKINGFLVVRFNDREKRNYPDLGSFGVIDAEQYTGDIDFDRDAMEYTDADCIEVAVEQARGLESESDFSEEPPVCTVIVSVPWLYPRGRDRPGTRGSGGKLMEGGKDHAQSKRESLRLG